MSSWIDSREANPKRQKAATSNIETGGAFSLPFWNRETFFGDKVEDVVKDSQDEGPTFRDGGLQNSSNGIDPAVVGFVLRDSTEGCHGDGDGLYAWNPISEDFSEQEAERVESDSSYPKKRLLSSINWKGKQSQSALTKYSEGSFPESVRKGTRNLAVAQQLTREAADSDAHALEIVRNTELSSKPRGIPLAIRLQELVQQASSTGTSTVLRHPQLKSKKGDRRRQTHGKSFASSTKNDLSAIEDDIVEDVDVSGDLQGKKRDGRETHWKKSASSRKNDLSAIEDDIVEDFNSSGDLQKESLKGASAVPVISASLLWERCREAVELAPPRDTNPTSADQLSSKQALSGFSERLQNALNKLKSQQTEFQQSLISRQSLHGLSQCVVVLILEKHLEAQLTTCHCKVLQSPPEWNDCGHASVLALESVDDFPVVEVIFSSKMSGDLELEIGGVVRVHPPWQEIHGAGKFGKIILGTFFCETVE